MNRFKELYGITLTKRMAHEIVFVLMALETIFAFSYLGYIDFFTISSNTLHILIIAAAMIMGARGSVAVALTFVFTAMWIGSYSDLPFEQLFYPFVSPTPPKALLLVSSRLLFAVVTSYIFEFYFKRNPKHIYLGIAAIAIFSTLLHDLIVFAAYKLLFPAQYHALINNLFSLPLFKDWFSYVSAAACCCLLHYILSRKDVNKQIKYLCKNDDLIQKTGTPRVITYAKIGAVVIGFLCILYLRKKIFAELSFYGIALTDGLATVITAFLLQQLLAFICLFIIVSIIIHWINNFYIIKQTIIHKKFIEQNAKLANDALTGVFSRFAYQKAIDKYAADVPNDLAVFLIDINGLKRVNDQLGHKAGDEIICAAAECIEKAVGKLGSTFRIGGDEFVVFGKMNKLQIAATLKSLTKIIDAWSGVYAKKLSVAIGWARACDFAGCSIDRLIKEADKAMYKQKQEYYRQKSK